MADSVIRQGLRLLKATNFSTLNDLEIVEWFYSFLDAIKAREGTYRLESQDVVDGELGMVWWDPCPACEADCDSESTKACPNCKGNGIINNPSGDVQNYYDTLAEMGGEPIYVAATERLTRIIKQLGGDIFNDEWLGDAAEPASIIYVPVLIRKYHECPTQQTNKESKE